MKKCSKCGVEKSEDEFHKDKRRSRGVVYSCKKCQSKYAKLWRLKNLERTRECSAQWYIKNKKRASTTSKKYYVKNKNIILKKTKKYREKNRDKSARWSKKWRENNKERRRLYSKEWRKNNKEKDQAHKKLNYALKTGKIIKQNCEFCGSAKSFGHHPNYNFPLIVRWVCPLHHSFIHKTSINNCYDRHNRKQQNNNKKSSTANDRSY